MTPPIKSWDLLADEVIDNEIAYWLETRDRAPHQLDLAMDEAGK